MKQRNSYSPELRERAVRLVLDQQGEHDSQWAAVISVLSNIGFAPETLRKWVRQAERDHGRRALPEGHNVRLGHARWLNHFANQSPRRIATPAGWRE